MYTTFLILKKEWMKSKKHPIQLLLTLLLPIIVTCLVILFSNQMKPSIRLGFINESARPDIIKSLEESSSLSRLTFTPADANSLYSDLMISKYAAIIKLKSDYTFEVFSLDAELKEQLSALLQHYSTQEELPLFSSLLGEQSSGTLSSTSRSMSFIFLSMIITATLLAISIHREKTEGLLTRYGLSPHHSLAYVTGFFLFNLGMTLLQTFLTAGLIFTFKLPLDISLSLFILIGSLISFSCSTLAFLIVSLTSHELSANILASSIGLLLSLLGGAFLPLTKMPHSFKVISQFTFTRWLIEATDLLTLKPLSSSSYFPIVAMLLLTFVLLFFAFILNVKKFSSSHNGSRRVEA